MRANLFPFFKALCEHNAIHVLPIVDRFTSLRHIRVIVILRHRRYMELIKYGYDSKDEERDEESEPFLKKVHQFTEDVFTHFESRRGAHRGPVDPFVERIDFRFWCHGEKARFRRFNEKYEAFLTSPTPSIDNPLSSVFSDQSDEAEEVESVQVPFPGNIPPSLKLSAIYAHRQPTQGLLPEEREIDLDRQDHALKRKRHLDIRAWKKDIRRRLREGRKIRRENRDRERELSLAEGDQATHDEGDRGTLDEGTHDEDEDDDDLFT
ncbi:hypothetical protein EJ08DRAFT_17502 [Tothia fuscella]|uniref:Uncharacterized protein n=1 Tax=Tothia fuscella TaxID=1048955 RepID=A0A9P4U1V1_9PEZI|nr:hypothetical protein EJ08DRAFT_17502 [Tothia fuscella]